jgi:hypothetical protein
MQEANSESLTLELKLGTAFACWAQQRFRSGPPAGMLVLATAELELWEHIGDALKRYVGSASSLLEIQGRALDMLLDDPRIDPTLRAQMGAARLAARAIATACGGLGNA